jgi:hypothetical protein
MHWYVERTRLALSFVDISIGLRGYSGCQAVHKTLGTPEPFVCLSADIYLPARPLLNESAFLRVAFALLLKAA